MMTVSKAATWVLVAIAVAVYLDRRRPSLALVPKNDANPPAPVPADQVPGPRVECFAPPCPWDIPNRRN